jgi:hypothetical protein
MNENIEKEIAQLEAEIKALEPQKFNQKGEAVGSVFTEISKKSAKLKELRSQQQTEAWQKHELENQQKQTERQNAVNAARKNSIYGGW